MNTDQGDEMQQAEQRAQKANDNFVTVPPDHKVVVVHATKSAGLVKCESGYWIAQMGTQGMNASVIIKLKKLARETGKANVIWIITPAFLRSLADEGNLIAEMSSIVEESKGTLNHSAVFPGASSFDHVFIKKVRELGVSAYSSADDGACFVEVHKPEGIVVGMPGQQYDD